MPDFMSSFTNLLRCSQAVLRLFTAATAGDTLELERLLASPILANHISCEDEDSWTPLHHAVDGSHLAAAMVLVSCSADVNAANNSGDTPLHLALRWSFVETASFLLAQPGIDVNAQVRIDMPELAHRCAVPRPMSWRLCGLQHMQQLPACSPGSRPSHMIISTSLRKIAMQSVVRQNEDGWTALHEACCSGTAELIAPLLSKGADVNARCKDGSIPLHKAARCGSKPIVIALLKRGADTKAKDKASNPVSFCTVCQRAK